MIDALRRFAPAWLDGGQGCTHVRSTLSLLLKCRTAALGGHRYECDHCGYAVSRYYSCRNRHCSQCQGLRRRRWAEAKEALLLPVPHFQVVFTLPDELRPIARRFQREIYNVVLRASSETLHKLAAVHWSATPAILAVLHTWARNLSFHPHVHCVVSAGGLAADGGWVAADPDFLFPVAAMKRLFRGIVLARLTQLELPLSRPERIALRNARRAAARKSWSLRVESPRGRDRGHLVRYLARYVYQTAIDDRRILRVHGDRVTFRTRGASTVTLSGHEFVRRFSLHILPKRFRRIRQYGLLAPGQRPRLELARQIATHLAEPRPVVARADPVSTPTALAPSAAGLSCPCPVCRTPLRVRRLEAQTIAPPARAPP